MFCEECSNEYIKNEYNKRFIYPLGDWIYIKLVTF